MRSSAVREVGWGGSGCQFWVPRRGDVPDSVDEGGIGRNVRTPLISRDCSLTGLQCRDWRTGHEPGVQEDGIDAAKGILARASRCHRCRTAWEGWPPFADPGEVLSCFGARRGDFGAGESLGADPRAPVIITTLSFIMIGLSQFCATGQCRFKNNLGIERIMRGVWLRQDQGTVETARPERSGHLRLLARL